MSDELDRGITVTEMAAMDQPIDVATETTAVFIGRALRGPVDIPILVKNYAAYERRFGGAWQRSSLAPAVRQYFEHGGRRLFIVRVANNARGAMICLPAAGGVLVLRALEPGSTEKIRAAIDYDGIAAADQQRFNLTVQRISPETGLVMDQEIFRRVTCQAGEIDYVEDAVLSSSLIRVHTPFPAGRPRATGERYAEAAQSGSDGQVISDYDLVGSAMRGTGIFALNEVDRFDVLYMPPPAPDQVPGPAAVLAAERYCRKRGAMLILDPPDRWSDVACAIAGSKESAYASENIIAYFPRIVSSTDSSPVVAGGAVAGLLCKLDNKRGPWEVLDQRGFGFARHFKPALKINVADARSLVKEGINVIVGHAADQASFCGSVTLTRAGHFDRKFLSLNIRRLCLSITTTIEHAIRWAVFEAITVPVANRIQSQVHAYLCSLAAAGAFADDEFTVQCRARLHAENEAVQRSITVLLNFRPVGSPDTLSLTLHQTASDCRVATTAFAPSTADCA